MNQILLLLKNGLIVNKIIIIIVLISSTNLQAQRFIAKNGKISFFSNAPMEDISAQNNNVSAVYDSNTKELMLLH